MGLKWIYSLLRSCGKNLMDLAKGTQWTSFSSGYQNSLSFFIEIQEFFNTNEKEGISMEVLKYKLLKNIKGKTWTYDPLKKEREGKKIRICNWHLRDPIRS